MRISKAFLQVLTQTDVREGISPKAEIPMDGNGRCVFTLTDPRFANLMMGELRDEVQGRNLPMADT
jgi:hypothetical protein